MKQFYRSIREGWLPLTGERAELTKFITDYLDLLEEDEKLFPFSNQRAWQIITTLDGYPPHYHRAFGEDYLYDTWDKDAIAVSDRSMIDHTSIHMCPFYRLLCYP